MLQSLLLRRQNLPCRTWNGQKVLQLNKWSHRLACWGKLISRTSVDISQSYLLKFEQLCRAFEALMTGKYSVTNENKVDCPLRRVGMVRGNYSNYFYTNQWKMRPAIHPQCSANLPCLFTPRKASAAFPDFLAFQYFSKRPLNDKCILKTEVSFLCHNAKGNRNPQYATCKSLKNNSRNKTQNYCPCDFRYIGKKPTGWLILHKAVKYKSHFRDFKSPAFS